MNTENFDAATFYLSMEGRIGRGDYWLKFFLPIFALSLIVGAVARGHMAISVLFNLAAIWPSIAVTAKRWHDRDKSAWWILINLIPIIGWIWALIETGFLKGTEGDNRYGSSPV